MKRMKRPGVLAAALTLAMAGAQSGCTTSEGTGDGPLSVGQGRLVVDLVDAPSTAVKELWVTVDKVTAHSTSAGWVTVMTGAVTVDLLKLTTSAQPLGFSRLPPGTVTQIRLHLAANGPQSVVLPDGTSVALKTPSGTQSGIKIQGPFEVSACNNTAVTLDFDGKKSLWVHPTGHEDLWVLRPVIRVKKTATTPAPCGGAADDAGSIVDGGSVSGVDEGPGSACATGADCLSGRCTNGLCEPSGPGAACRASADCVGGACQEDGLCAPGPAGGVASTCLMGSQCLSNTCTDGVCEAGGQGSYCRAAADCAEGFSCEAEVCQPTVN